MRRRAALTVAVSAVLVATGCAASNESAAPEDTARATVSTAAAPEVLATTRGPDDGMCGFADEPPERYKHVIWIWFEDKSYEDIVGSPLTSYLNNTIAEECALATDFHNVTHPSLPNYIAAIAGAKLVERNCLPRNCAVDERSLFRRIEQADRSWATYAQSMPKPCYRQNDGKYAVRHNPAPYFKDIRDRCKRNSLPLGKSEGPFATDLAENTLPSFSFVIPNLCRGMHDCSIAEGDDFLSIWVPRIVDSQAYRSGRTAVFISFDEGSHEVNGRNCITSEEESCHIATYVLGPAVEPGAEVGEYLNHYSALRATQNMLNAKPYLRKAKDAPHMRSLFGL